MNDPTRPSTHERYAAASTSSHLEIHPTRLGDVDMLIAAGVCRDSLGTRLYRLQCEFDAVRGRHHLAIRSFDDRMTLARELQQSSLAAMGSASAAERAGASRGLQIAGVMKTDAEKTFTSERLLVLSALTSFQPARDSMRNFAATASGVQAPNLAPTALNPLADRVLDLWLDPICPRCDGRGSTGGYGTPLVLCPAPAQGGCDGARLRPVRFGARLEQEFGRWLLCEMDRKTTRVSQLIGQYLYGRPAPARDQKDPEPASVRDLHARLAEMRSAQAQED